MAATGTLYVVATPIGNLEDMTYRAVRILGSAPTIAAEDTRSAERLIAHFGLRRPRLVSYFEGNEARRTEELLERLAAGEDVALISDAGLPGISDPGQRVVAAAIAAGHRVEVIPGPSASLTALVASGLPTDRFLFVGFPPRESGARRELFGGLRAERATLIFYESPARAGTTLADLADALGGDRPACLARELTKLHEEIVRASLSDLATRYAETAPRGECTIIVAGATDAEAAAAVAIDIEAAINDLLAQGIDAKEIASRLALATGKPRRQIYQLALALSRSK